MKITLFNNPFKYLLLILLSSVFTVNSKATNYYSDPTAAGSMTNTGSFASPWANLQAIFSANKTFLAGDTIFLRTGNHGYPIIKGVNTNFVVIMPQASQTPVIDQIRISASPVIAAAYWKLYKLTIQSEAAFTGTLAPASYPNLVDIYPYAKNITVSTCTITSNLNTTGWTRYDWRNRCKSGIITRAQQNSNLIIEKNLIKNIAFGVQLTASNAVFSENTIENFTNDASRIVGSFILFEKNKVTDLIKVMTYLENHDDLCQAFVEHPGKAIDTLKNCIIRNNIFINYTDTTRSFRGSAQGIGGFDGPYLNWTVENNIVIVDQWHGISFYGAINCKIINNTVIDPYNYSPLVSWEQPTSTNTSIGPAWILISQKSTTATYTAPASSNNLIKNNLVAKAISLLSPSVAVSSNNIIIGAASNYSLYFVNVSNTALPSNFDLHLKSGCPAIDAGNLANAPLTDYDGISRPQGPNVDIGAYEYVVIPTSLVENTMINNEAVVFPNPFSHQLNIHVDHELATNCNVQLFNLNGQLVFEETIAYPIKLIKLTNLPEMPRGMYFIKMIDSKGYCSMTKLIKTD